MFVSDLQEQKLLKRKRKKKQLSSYEQELYKSIKRYVDVQYGQAYSCSNYGCDNEGICRCSTIEDAHVEINNETISGFLAFYWADDDMLANNLAERLVRRCISSDDFEVQTCSGYYGQEIDTVTFSSYDFWKKAETFNSLNNVDRLKMVMTLENGFLIPQLTTTTSLDMRHVNLSCVAQSINISLKAGVIADYANYLRVYAHDNYRDKLGERLKKLAPIVVQTTADSYQVIDGRHRLEALKQTKIITHTVTTEQVKKKRKVKNKDEYQEYVIEREKVSIIETPLNKIYVIVVS